ncbi:MAG: hypothetical protein ACI83H_001680 [Glaciecola sp.]|jgi:hypothetical protein
MGKVGRPIKRTAEAVVKDIRRQTRRKFGSVPSKIFENSKLGLPILYFGGGREGEDIIKNNKLAWIAKAGDYEGLNLKIAKIIKSEIAYDFKKK